MLQINYIQAYQTTEIFPWWDKKKKSNLYPSFSTFIDSKCRKIHTHTTSNLLRENCSANTLPAQLWCFTPPTPQWPLSLSVFVLSGQWGLFAWVFSPPLPFSFIFQQKKKGKETGWGEKDSVTEVVHYKSNWNKNFLLQITSKQMFLS